MTKDLEMTLKFIEQFSLKDEQGGIRTNATVCLAKIAHLLSIQTRQTSLLNILLKCTRDPFVPAKLSAVSALAASQHLFLFEDVATKLLPCLSFLTIDPEKEVREQTFKAIEFAVSRLKEYSQNPEMVKTIALENKEAQNQISWKNWAVNLIKKSEPASKIQSEKNNVDKSLEKFPNEAPKKVDRPSEVSKLVMEHIEKREAIDNDFHDDDDEWAPLEEVNQSKVLNTKTNTSDHWDSNSGDFFDNLIKEPQQSVASKPKKPLQLSKKNGAKKPVDTKVTAPKEDGWGDVDW